MAAIEEFVVPQTLEEATAALAQSKAVLLAGGTDLVPRWSRGTAVTPDVVVDVKHIDALRGISRRNGEILIGACTLMSELESDPVIRSSAPVLASAAGRIACPQIRNRATVAGNLCNASPAADTAVPLLLHDAVLDVASSGPSGMDVREVALADFFRGPGVTTLEPTEILVRVRLRPLPPGSYSAWDKFGTRPAMEIAVASVGVAFTVVDGTIANARVGYGSVAPVPLRGRRAEAELNGHALTSAVIERCVSASREEIAPISDVRAGAAYRKEIVAVMLRRMLENADNAS